MARRAEGRAGTPATVALVRAAIPFTAHAYTHEASSTSFGLEAAEKLDVDAGRVFKTLLTDVDGRLVVGVVPVTGQLDLKALAAALKADRNGECNSFCDQSEYHAGQDSKTDEVIDRLEA
ncbi:MAG: hypothetical protein LH624_07805, partial [Cryobacterium sp.]|nr:hypothetical protein [Cryobacterium sp.]